MAIGGTKMEEKKSRSFLTMLIKNMDWMLTFYGLYMVILLLLGQMNVQSALTPLIAFPIVILLLWLYPSSRDK